MELELDDGKRREKKNADGEPLAKVCPRCAFVRPPALRKCPSCGYEPVIVPGKVSVGAGELELRQRYPREKRQEIYSALLSHAREKGYKDGWAAVQYKNMCGTWPNGLSVVTGTTVAEVDKWLVHLRIKKAKSKSSKEANRCGCGSTDTRVTRVSGQTQVACQTCGKSWWRTRKFSGDTGHHATQQSQSSLSNG
jgi:hypothetical protein